MIKLSVITTVFNGELFLRESIDSILSQEFNDFEFIIIDDGSTDSTPKILTEYTGNKKIRILQNKYNEGIAVSRNRGLLESKGIYVAIHDADDISLPLRFKKQIDILDSNKEIGFLGSHAMKISPCGHIMGEMKYPPKSTSSAFIHIMKHKLNPIIDPSSMFRKKLVLDRGGYKMEMRHSMDFDLWCRLLLHQIQLTNICEPLIKYRIHENSISSTQRSDMRKVADDICVKFQRKSLDDPILRSNYFQQDCFTEFVNDKIRRK